MSLIRGKKSDLMVRFEKALKDGDTQSCLNMLTQNADFATRIERNAFGQDTALMAAIRNGNADVCDKLLDMGAKLNLPLKYAGATDTALSYVLTKNNGYSVKHPDVQAVMVKHYTERRQSQHKAPAGVFDQLKAKTQAIFNSIVEKLDDIVTRPGIAIAGMSSVGTAAGLGMGALAMGAPVVAAGIGSVLVAGATIGAGVGLISLVRGNTKNNQNDATALKHLDAKDEFEKMADHYEKHYQKGPSILDDNNFKLPKSGPFSGLSERATQFLAHGAKSGQVDLQVNGVDGPERQKMERFVRGVAPSIGVFAALALTSLQAISGNVDTVSPVIAPNVTVQSGESSVNIPKMVDLIRSLDASAKEQGDAKFVAEQVRGCTDGAQANLTDDQIIYGLTHAAVAGSAESKGSIDGKDVERINARAVIMTVKEIIDWAHATDRSPVMAVAAYCAAPGVAGQWKEQLQKWDSSFSKMDADQVSQFSKSLRKDNFAGSKPLSDQGQQPKRTDQAQPRMIKVSGSNIFQWANAASNVGSAVLRATGREKEARLAQTAGSVTNSAGSLVQQGRSVNQTNGASALSRVGSVIQSGDNVATQTARAAQQYYTAPTVTPRVNQQSYQPPPQQYQQPQQQIQPQNDPYNLADQLKQRSGQSESNDVIINGLKFTREGRSGI